jgi:hypothetical protein
MFHAFIIVCAASISYEIDQNSCFRINDTWGPYRTEENCEIRVTQMTGDVLDGSLTAPLFNFMGNPPMMHAEGYCEKIGNDKEV